VQIVGISVGWKNEKRSTPSTKNRWGWMEMDIPVSSSKGNQVPDVDVVGVLPSNLATEPHAMTVMTCTP
jgi:hypothetical protein